jgi:hypothetical protein
MPTRKVTFFVEAYYVQHFINHHTVLKRETYPRKGVVKKLAKAVAEKLEKEGCIVGAISVYRGEYVTE